MKKILFVINTMGRAGAEISLLRLLNKMNSKEYDISLYVLTGQGEMMAEVPSYVKIRNPVFSKQSVLSKAGRYELIKTVIKSFFRNGKYIKKVKCIIENFIPMLMKRRIQPDKLFWRILSEGALYFEEEFDLAVAWLEGGSAYYVSDFVKARKKAAFIHIDYEKAGYTREMDQNCWEYYNKIFVVSDDARKSFLSIYPENTIKTMVFNNMIDQEYIRSRAKEAGGFSDGYSGKRILTVGRLAYQKGYDVAIDAMKLLKDSGRHVRWYVLGEGGQRKNLERKIDSLGLKEDFLLLGSVDNPYPYYAQTDLYVHAVRYEGQGIAVLEAQTLGCPVIVSKYCDSEDQIKNGKYGISCELTPDAIADSIISLLDDDKYRLELGKRAATKEMAEGQEKLLLELLD